MEFLDSFICLLIPMTLFIYANQFLGPLIYHIPRPNPRPSQPKAKEEKPLTPRTPKAPRRPRPIHPFEITNLPIELALKILVLAATQSQSTYRALLLTRRSINDLIRLEVLPYLAITLFTQEQVSSFRYLVTKDSEVASRVRFLWMIYSPPGRNTGRLGKPWTGILENCHEIVSLACLPEMLSSVDVVTRNKKLVDLTVLEELPVFGNQALYNQLENLHIIEGGGGIWFHRMTHYTIPSFPRLRSVSISLGQRSWIPVDHLSDWRNAQKLERLAFITRAHAKDNVPGLAANVEACKSGRYDVSLLYAPRRWTERKMWETRAFDRNQVWKLRKADDVFGIRDG